MTFFGYLKFVPLKKRRDVNLTLTEVFQEVGVPTGIHTTEYYQRVHYPLKAPLSRSLQMNNSS